MNASPTGLAEDAASGDKQLAKDRRERVADILIIVFMEVYVMVVLKFGKEDVYVS